MYTCLMTSEQIVIATCDSGDWYCKDCKPQERTRSPKKKVRRVFSSTEESEDDSEAEEQEVEQDEVDEEDEEEEEEERIPKKKSKGNSKAKKKLEVEEKRPPPKKKALSALLGKRKAATDAEDKIRAGNMVEEVRETVKEGTRTRPKRGADDKENARSKRRREVDDDIELQFNMAGLEDLVNGAFHVSFQIYDNGYDLYEFDYRDFCAPTGMIKHRDGWPFDRPITKAEAPDYHAIIAKPMDLGTIK